MTEARGSGVKTLGIKVPDSLHAQFTLVAQLDGISLGESVKRNAVALKPEQLRDHRRGSLNAPTASEIL